MTAERQEIRGGKAVTVVSRERTPEDRLREALAEMQAKLKAMDPGWKPKHPVK